MYMSYQEAAAPATTPQASHDLPTTSEYYRPSMDGVLDLNAPDIASTFADMQMQSPDFVYRAMYGFDLFGWTPPSAFTVAYIDPNTFDQQHHEEDQDHHHRQQPEDQQGRPIREIRPHQCHTCYLRSCSGQSIHHFSYLFPIQ